MHHVSGNGVKENCSSYGIRILIYFCISGKEDQFEIRPESENDLQGTCYDYESVMHYPEIAFAEPALVQNLFPCDETADIGQRTHLSAIDIERIRLLYDCAYPVSFCLKRLC